MGLLSDLFTGGSSQKQPPKPKQVDSWSNSKPEETAGAVGLGGAPLPEKYTPPKKVIPELEFTKVTAKQSSDCEHLDVWAFVENTSDIEVEITQANFIKQRERLGRFLKPGGGYELHLYAGQTPTDDAEVTAKLTYKAVRSGDYFEASYSIGYHCVQNAHGEHHIPQSLSLMTPIHEVNQ